MSEVEGARPVREEDAFDVDALVAWLRKAVDDPSRFTGRPEVRQFSGGVSNLTYLLRFPSVDAILRRPPAGQKARSAHDMGREYRIQQALRPVFPYVPQMYASCDDESVIGSPFYVMERLAGTILRQDLPDGLSLDAAQVRRLCTDVLDLLVQLHDVDAGAVGLADLGRGSGYVARQVAGWSDRYRRARTPNVGSFEEVMAWLADRQPADVDQCLIHNDFRFDNVVLAADDPTRPVGLLDWEMATIGDPFMDLGGALAYWVQADDTGLFQAFRRQPTHLPGMLTRAEVVDYYCARSGRSLPAVGWAFYEVFGLFRLAVIAQQVYYRFHHGQTTNPAFAQFHVAVTMLEARCREVIARDA